jgi:hypothetical protein
MLGRCLENVKKEKSRALKTLEIKPTSQRWKPIDKFLKTKSPN